MSVRFPESVPDETIRFAVTVARVNGRLLLCRHRDRDSWECPGGHRETGETGEQAARRELYEETGATKYRLRVVGPYIAGDSNFAGLLCAAEIDALDPIPPSEIAETRLFDALPEKLTYPEIIRSIVARAGRGG